MAYDPDLAARVRDLLAPLPDMSERRMMGGLCFMVGDHMACGIVQESLLARVGREGYAEALQEPHVRRMEMSGRAMSGFVLVDPPGLEGDELLFRWVGRGVAIATALPPKDKARRPKGGSTGRRGRRMS